MKTKKPGPTKLELFDTEEPKEPKGAKQPAPRRLKPQPVAVVYANELDKLRGELDIVTDKVIAERFSFNLMFRNTVAFSAFLKKIKPLIEKYGHELTTQQDDTKHD